MLLPRLTATLVGAYVLLGSTLAHSIQRNPINHVALIDEPVIHTPSHRAHSLSTFDLTFHLHGKRQYIKLKLEPNHDVIAEGATVNYLGPDGSISRTEVIERAEHRVFMGSAFLQRNKASEWVRVGWARIMIHRDGPTPIFEGAFLMEGDHNHIQTSENYLQTKLKEDPRIPDGAEDHMVLWRDSDIQGSSQMGIELKRDVGEDTCSSDRLLFNSNEDHPLYASMRKREDPTGFFGSISTRSLFTRQSDIGGGTGNTGNVNLASTIGNTAGCPTTRKVALVGVATDCTYTADFANSSAARTNIINQMNLASQQYESSFNITLGLRNLTLSEASCPSTASTAVPWNIGCSSNTDIQDRLNLFSAWRGEQGDSNAYWTLLTKCATDSAVGLAWLGQACVNSAQTSSNETVSSANVVVRTSTEWQVIAHETGHTFGAVHDCYSVTCADGTTEAAQQCCPLSASVCDANQQFIMNPSTGSGITQFSACTVGNICSAIGRNAVNTQCLTANRNVVTISEAQCGNGIVEQGEDCDCGGESGCGENSCCNPTTCTFTTGSVCDPSNEDCCNSSCQFASNGTVCRTSTGACDPQETCPGNSAFCPVNVNAPDGTSCGTSGQSLYCASGQCTSRDAQCQSLMGSISHSNTTYACPDQSDCQVKCQSPALGSNVCFQMTQNFLDGTDCGSGGRCENGQCQGSSNWFDRNKTLVIGLAAGIGGLLVVVILGCCISSCVRSSRRSRLPSMPPPVYRGRPMQQPQRGGWHGNYGGPVPPPMVHGGQSGGWGPDGRWNPNFGRSERYA